MECFTLKDAMRTGKGQSTIEFLLVIIVGLAYLVSVVIPHADTAQSAAQDASELGKLRLSVEKVANAIQYVSISGVGTKQSTQVVLPAGSSIVCQTVVSVACQTPPCLTMNYPLKSKGSATACISDDEDPSAPENPDNCKKVIEIGVPFTCSESTISAGFEQGAIYNTVISRVPTGTRVDFSVV